MMIIKFTRKTTNGGVKEFWYHCGLPADYENIESVDGISYQFLIYKDGHVGLVNLLDKVEVWLEPIYDNINVFNNLHIIVYYNGLKGYWHNGQLTEVCFEDIYMPKFAGSVKVKKDRIWG